MPFHKIKLPPGLPTAARHTGHKHAPWQGDIYPGLPAPNRPGLAQCLPLGAPHQPRQLQNILSPWPAHTQDQS